MLHHFSNVGLFVIKWFRLDLICGIHIVNECLLHCIIDASWIRVSNRRSTRSSTRAFARCAFSSFCRGISFCFGNSKVLFLGKIGNLCIALGLQIGIFITTVITLGELKRVCGLVYSGFGLAKAYSRVPFLKKAPNASFAVIFDIAACFVEHDGTPSW